MSNEIDVRNNVNMIIGWIRDYGDRKIATHYRKGFVGSYTVGSNITTDAKGHIYCFGDGLSDLVRQADRG